MIDKKIKYYYFSMSYYCTLPTNTVVSSVEGCTSMRWLFNLKWTLNCFCGPGLLYVEVCDQHATVYSLCMHVNFEVYWESTVKPWELVLKWLSIVSCVSMSDSVIAIFFSFVYMYIVSCGCFAFCTLLLLLLWNGNVCSTSCHLFFFGSLLTIPRIRLTL